MTPTKYSGNAGQKEAAKFTATPPSIRTIPIYSLYLIRTLYNFISQNLRTAKIGGI